MTTPLPILEAPRIVLRFGSAGDAPSVLDFFTQNRDHLTPWWPRWCEEQFTLEFWQESLEASIRAFEEDRSVRFLLFARERPDRVIGVANFNQIVRGVAQYAVLGYGIAADCEGEGLMSEALREAIRYMFEEKRLHRIMANYIPRNERSGVLLKRLGFVEEGYARDYLMINGMWEDHILTALVNPDWRVEE